jgi:heme-degrading monooxygenase HmoA
MNSQTPTAAGSGQCPIELHVDLAVNPAKEREMLDNFHNVFRPAASKQPGYIAVKLLKLRSSLAGAPPQDANYRFVLIFENEELRQQWVATPTHQEVWPTIANTLAHPNYTILLYDAPE